MDVPERRTALTARLGADFASREAVLSRLSPSSELHRLMSNGVAFHHGGALARSLALNGSLVSRGEGWCVCGGGEGGGGGGGGEEGGSLSHSQYLSHITVWECARSLTRSRACVPRPGVGGRERGLWVMDGGCV